MQDQNPYATTEPAKTTDAEWKSLDELGDDEAKAKAAALDAAREENKKKFDEAVKQTEAAEKSKESKAVMAIPIDKDGRIAVRDNAEMMRYCAALIHGEGVPARFDTPTKLFAALMYVRELRLPDTAIRQVAEIHGVIACFGDLPLALVQRTNELAYFREAWFDKQYQEIKFENKNLDAEVWGAVCFASRCGKQRTEILKDSGVQPEIQSFSFTMKDAEQAGLYPAKKKDGSASPQSPWMKYTRMMLRYKARSIAMKSLFADSINGLAIAEYDFDQISPSEMVDVTPRGDRTSPLGEKVRASQAEDAARES